MKLVVRTPPFWFYSLECVDQEFCEIRSMRKCSSNSQSIPNFAYYSALK